MTTTKPQSTNEALPPEDMTDDELEAAIDFHTAEAARFRNEVAKIWRLRIRMDGGIAVDKQMLAELHERRAGRVSSASAAPVVDETVYADGFCARCSELAYPLTRALEKTGVPTGADNWQQTYGPNKVRALADLETCLRRLLFALEEGKAEDIKERITWANHYIEFHAAIRRRLTAAAQEQDKESHYVKPYHTYTPISQERHPRSLTYSTCHYLWKGDLQ